MAGARGNLSVVPSGPGEAEASRPRASAKAPFVEGIKRSGALWVTSPDKYYAQSVFRRLAWELRSRGFRCDSDLQTEPDERLKIASCFEVSRHPEGVREPEPVGMVTLYLDGDRYALKANPDHSGYHELFHSALGAASEFLRTARGRMEPIEFTVHEQDRYPGTVS